MTLTGHDATKFQSQVAHGRPKAAAIENVRKGVELSRAFQKAGRLLVTITKRTPQIGS